jgi:putative hemin transport protein
MTTAHSFRHDPTALREAWRALRDEQRVRARDAAEQLGVSEAELIASRCGAGTTRLQGDFRRLLERAHELGTVMALTRNADVVHEKIGRYENVSAEGLVGLALGDDIDLRLFFGHWRLGYAMGEPVDAGTRFSLQFFDACGTAVHKIFLREGSNGAAWDALLEAFAADDQAPGESVSEAVLDDADEADAVDVAGFLSAWAQMQDTHEFFPLLRRFRLSRTRALELARETFAHPVAPAAARALLLEAARSQLPIMVFVGNPGCIQIHTGPVRNVQIMGPWLNVMDPGFNLHLREDRIAQAWVVRKPTSEGDVTSLELFNAAGETMAMLFGKRKPGIPELQAWRDLVAQLPARVPSPPGGEG